MAASSPIFSFGVIADVQYADKSNGNIDGRVQRYREAAEKLESAVKAFNSEKESLAFVVSLGDIIDGNVSKKKIRQDFDVVLSSLAKIEVGAVHHVLGNHCLHLPREVLLRDLGMPARYYEARVNDRWRVVFLDSMDMSVQWPDGSENRLEAQAFIDANHPIQCNNPAHREPRYQASNIAAWNGGLTSRQLTWLQGLLDSAKAAGEKVIVCLHHPLVKDSSPTTHLMWESDKVSALLRESGVVPLVLSGHFHVGGYGQQKGTHFVVMEAILEAPEGLDAHAIVDVYADRIVIRGSGAVTSRTLKLGAASAKPSRTRKWSATPSSAPRRSLRLKRA